MSLKSIFLQINIMYKYAGVHLFNSHRFIYHAAENKMNLVLLPVETYCCVSVSSVYFFLFKAEVQLFLFLFFFQFHQINKSRLTQWSYLNAVNLSTSACSMTLVWDCVCPTNDKRGSVWGKCLKMTFMLHSKQDTSTSEGHFIMKDFNRYNFASMILCATTVPH